MIQFGVLLILTAITLGAERINEFGSRNWSKFATQNYFDSSGLFMMVFVSGPFVVIANFIVVSPLSHLYGFVCFGRSVGDSCITRGFTDVDS